MTLAAGENNTTLDAGVYAPVSIGDKVFEDKDGDGVQDAGEPGIDGVTVRLYNCVTNQLLATQVTANGGLYNFTGLPPGTYHVVFETPNGFVQTVANVGDDASDSDAGVGGQTACYTLSTGQSNTTVDAGFYRTASLGDYVWLDNNNNGAQDDGAPSGVNGVVVNLLNAAGAVIATTTTGNDGSGNPGYYRFANLVPGEYSVEFVKPAGYSFAKRDLGGDASDSDADTTTGRTITTVLESGENDLSWDAGLVRLASLGDRLWVDADGDGQQDAGEAGVAGATVTLIGGGADGLINGVGDTSTTTTTDANGIYNFSGLNVGEQYQVQFSAPAGTVFTAANQGNDATDSDADSTGKTQVVTLAAGENNTTLDAGVYNTASLGNKVWVDIDKDGVQDANEGGVAGVRVFLLNAAGKQVGSLTTDANGEYLFTNLTPGDYSVRFDLTTLPQGYTVTTRDAAAANDLTDSDADPTTGRTITTSLESGEVDLSWDLGIQANIGIDLEKLVRGEYLVQNSGGGEGLTPGFWKNHSSYGPAPLSGWPETGLSPDASYESIFGVNVPNTNPTLLQALGMGGGEMDALLRHSTAALLNASNPYVDYAYTRAQIITMVQSAFSTGKYNATKDLFAAQNELGADLNTPSTTGSTLVVTPDVDADTPGSGPIIPVGGTAVFTYLVKNTGATELSNVMLVDDRIPTLTFVGGDTDADGRLDVTETWRYTARETVQSNVQYVNIGTVTAKDATSGVTVTDADKAHYNTPALGQSLGDRVWLDSNANGVQDNGEQGIADVTVQLKNTAGTVLQTTTTDAQGNYLFDVAVGSYQVTVLTPTGYAVTKRDAGANDGLDSDIDVTSRTTGTINIAAGQQNLTVDAGLVLVPQTASIGNRVWLDCNGNGLQDTGELGVAGVTVKLLNSTGGVVGTQTTDANGNYLFSNVVPGSYALEFGTLSGYTRTVANVDSNGSDASDSDADPTTGRTAYTTLTAGETDLSWDAGLQPVCRNVSFDFSGNSALDGTDGNSRQWTDTLTGVSVTARAFSQDKDQSTNAASNTWQKAYLGAYGGGLGVTDSSEGSGDNNTHMVDNVGRNNYVVLQFSQDVKLDKAFLGYVVNDSDVQVWIGNSDTAITTMSNAVLGSMGFSEVNATTATGARWADLNAGGATGNVIIIAADTTDTTPDDRFKLEHLAVCAPDLCAPVAKASIGNFVWEDRDYDGVQDAGEAGVANVTVKLLNSANTVLASTTTDANGQYSFGNLNPADYKIQVVAPSGYLVTKRDTGGNDALDSDVDSSGTTVTTTLVAGENDLSWDAGLYRKASVGDRVWEDADHDDVQDATERGIGGVKVALLNSAGTQVASTVTNANGNYLFSDLDPGAYQLRFDKKDVIYNGVNMNNWKWASKDIGSNDNIDSDVAGDGVSKTNVTTTSQFTLLSGANDMSRDAGITPIVIDLNGNGIQTTSRSDSQGGFDLFGNGTAIRSGWISGDDGFLAVDRNGNGKIDNIGELFGGSTKGAGFAGLAAFDSNDDGLVNDLDAEFGQLMIWRDANGSHGTDAGELMTLAQAGVASLTVGYTELPFLDAQGNLHLERSSATLTSGASVDMTDVYFNVSAEDAAAAGVSLPTMADLLGNDSSLDSLLGATPQSLGALADCGDPGCQSGGDASEALRRLAALSRESCQVPAAA
ncbi:MAG: SdrD B-like domain-containing protein [Pseudomonadota bacterium]